MTTFLYGANAYSNGIRQHYLRYGGRRKSGEKDRDPVIVLPGITSPAATWGFVGEVLGRTFDTYIVDIRGRGLSEASAALDYSLDAQADDVLALARALELPRFSLVGHSMGARIAIRAARQRPRGLARVVLIDPPVSGPGRRPYPADLNWYVQSIALCRGGAGPEDMRAFCPSWTEEQLRLRAEWLHTCDERAVRCSFEGFHLDDVHADLPRLAAPVLLIAAGRGDVIRQADIEEMSALVPAMRVARVPAAGHMIPWDDEAGFYEAFGDFLGAEIQPSNQSQRRNQDAG
ncbi:alpha/beta fold hydrolase [Bradyrhizobium elkanii]